MQSALGIIYAYRKLPQKALPRIQAALALGPEDPEILSNIAEAYGYLGDRRQCVHFYQRAMQKGYSLAKLRGNPNLQSLVSDPSFTAEVTHR